MKLFVVLLALRLTATEKLDRRYLPPPGAKLSGGRSDDLQTPLEYPKISSTYGTSDYRSTVYIADDTDHVKIGTPDKNEFSLVTNGLYYKSLSHLRSGLDPGHMRILAVPESIGPNYQPNIFGMYGGNPKSIKYFDNNIEVPSSDDLITSDEKINLPEEKVAPEVSPLQNHSYLPAEQYQPTKLGPNTGQNLSFNKIERPQVKSADSDFVLNYKNVKTPNEYFFTMDTSNGIHRDESASTVKGVKAKGSYSYKGDDGKVYTVTYTADENGFQPSGDHLPPIPEAIQTVIEQAQRNKDATGIIDDGSYDDTKYGHMKYQGPVHRYMQNNLKTHKRKKIFSEQKILGPLKIQKIETSNIMKSRTENLQTKQNKNEIPIGMRRVQLFDTSRNIEDAIYVQSPKTKENQGIYHTLDYRQKVNNNKDVSNGTVFLNIQRNRGIFNSNKEKNVPAIQDGYFYVPPENVFVDGKYQDKLFTDTNLNNTSVLEREINTDDQRRIFDKDLSKMTQFITSTEKPFYQQTYDGDFYASTNADVDQSIDHRRTKVIVPSSKKSGTQTNVQLYGNTPITKPYNEFTKETIQEEEIVIPENRVETELFSSQIDFDTVNYQSTTPMSSEPRYKIQTYENTNQYEITSESALTSSNLDVDYSKNEGYFRTTPEITETFENLPLSTYSPSIYTTEGVVSTESTTNVKVDEIGKTHQESIGYFTDSSIDSFTNGMQSDAELKVPTPYDDYNYTFSTDIPTTLNNKSITQFSNDYETDVNDTPDDLQLGGDAIIGEDFSGPKQPQRYDPKQGYYY